MIRAFVGAGGKTSFIKRYAKQLRAEGKKVFVTTSTHMYIEEDTLLTDDVNEIIEALEKNGYAMAGIKEGKKIKPLSFSSYKRLCDYADEVLIEADGSKHFPLKYPNQKEPVLYDNIDEIIVVFGMHGLGKRACEAIHRLELAKSMLNIEANDPVRPEHIQQLIRKGYLEKLKKNNSDKKITIKANENKTLYERAIAGLLEADMDVSLIKKEWFLPQPKLIICGGGHVSADIVKMASCLDFYIKVIDDRVEFANKERFPQVQEVICDSFEHLEKYLETDAYYIVVTRGHKDDSTCVSKILNTPYRYLGMIGSKTKVGKTFEKLHEAGFSKEQIDSIYAPIGLAIHAVTPAEIAVSILAQIIQVKNQKHSAFISKELLNVKESGMLCIIIEKTGSSPRGVGSMMFVNEDKIIETIGGGAVEFAVMEEARKNHKAMIKEYDLSNKDSQKLGMICGGKNKVLFIPI